MHILLFSEQPALQTCALAALRARGHQVLITHDANEARDALDRGQAEAVIYHADETSPAMATLLRHCATEAAPPAYRIAVIDEARTARLPQLINHGEVDYCLIEPVDETQLAAAISRVEGRRARDLAPREWTACLETRITSQIRKADKAFEDLLAALVMALDIRENESAFHSRRVALICLYFAVEYGLDPDRFEALYQGALLHDIGKIGIADAILLKPAALTPEERQIMQAHVSISVKLLSEIERLKASLEIPRHHHERFDGGGYLRGLSGTDIPLPARLFSIVDVYDALRSERPYKAPIEHERAVAILREGAGTQFDPDLVQVFCGIPPQVLDALGEACTSVRTFPQAMLACRRCGQADNGRASEPVLTESSDRELICSGSI